MKVPWNKVRGTIATEQSGPPPTDGNEFWSDFKARASLANQESVADAPLHGSFHWVVAARALAGVVLFAIMIAGAVFYVASREEGPNAVEYVEVIASHGGVLIMNDEESDGTILWVVDMELEDQGGDSI